MSDFFSRAEVTYPEQFFEAAAATDLPPGMVRFHKQDFGEYFQMTPDEFIGKSVLESGAGSGKHVAVLHMLRASVTAVVTCWSPTSGR